MLREDRPEYSVDHYVWFYGLRIGRGYFLIFFFLPYNALSPDSKKEMIKFVRGNHFLIIIRDAWNMQYSFNKTVFR